MSATLLAAAAGFFAGVIHVLSGPDHLAAVLPFALRDRRAALKVGITWGLGHGVGVAILALVAVLIRSSVEVESLSNFAESLVGVMLMIVGAWSIRQSGLVHVHTHDDHPHPHTHAHPLIAHAAPLRHRHSVLGFGVLHGLAGAGHLLGVLPAVALGRGASIAYVASFLAGGLGAMGVFAFAAGRIVIKAAWLPRALIVAGTTSIAVGAFWLVG